MEVSRKRKRADAGACGGGGGDRLSELPDCLLEEILSRLKARQVVQTCVLSSRWRRLWLTVPRLDIDAAEFRLPPPPPRSRSFTSLQELHKMEEDFNKLEDFVDNLLSRRGSSPLHTLRFRIAGFEGQKKTNYGRWVRRGLLFSPAALDVSMERLGGTIALPSFAAGGHRLTKLRLNRVVLHRDFGEMLASRLPVLQDLQITYSILHCRPRIVSASLKNLAVVRSYPPRPRDGDSATIDIVAPRLASLHIALDFGYLMWGSIALGEAPCLVRASVFMLPLVMRMPQEAEDILLDAGLLAGLGKLIGSLRNAATLELSGFRGLVRMPSFLAQVVPSPFLQAILNEKLPVFSNLRTITLDESDIGDIHMVRRYLHNKAPVLEKLTLKNSS